jgi:hypothetical protein
VGLSQGAVTKEGEEASELARGMMDEKSDEGDEGDEGISSKWTAKQLPCGCTRIYQGILLRIPQAGERVTDKEGVELLERLQDLHWARLCTRHLRRLTGGGLGMCTNMRRAMLNKWLKLVYQYRRDLSVIRRKKCRYFRQGSRPVGVAERLGPYM